MIRWFAMVVVAVVVATVVPISASAQNPPPTGGPLQMTIVGAQKVSPIAVSALKNLGGDDGRKVSTVFTDTLMRDLKLSSFFRMIDPQSYIEDPQTSGYDIGQFNFGDWRSINAEFLVKGSVKRDADKVTVEALLFNVGEQRRMMGKRFTGEPNEVGEMARRFADASA